MSAEKIEEVFKRIGWKNMSIDEKLNVIAEEVTSIHFRFDDYENRFKKLEIRFGNLETMLDNLETFLKEKLE